jgi:flagellar hook-length control protein FliK
MIDVMLAASPPTQVRPAATKFTPPKADEPEAFAADFERALKAKDQEMREADAARTASSAVNQKPARKPEHAPKAGSQGEMDKVQAAGRSKVSVPEHEKAGADPEKTTEPNPLEAGAAAVQPQMMAQIAPPAVVVSQPPAAEVTVVQSVDVKVEVQAVAVQPAIAAVTPSTGTVSAAAGQPAVQPAPIAPTQAVAADAAVQTPVVQGAVIPTAQVAVPQAAVVSSAQVATEATAASDGAKPATPASFAAALQTAEKAAGPDQGAALQAAQTVDPKQSVGQSTVAGQSAVAAKAVPELTQVGAQMNGMKVLKGAEKVEAAAVSAAAPASSASQAPMVVPQALEVKAVGGSLMATDAQTATAARPLEMMAQVARAVEASLQQGKNTLRMQLNPADLGAIDIRLVSSGHRVSMTVIAEQASTGRMLENQMEQLRQNLADAGVQLTQMHVGQQNQGSHFARNFAQQQPQNSFAAARLGQQGLTNEAETADDRSARARSAGAVDYRV